MKGVAVIGAGRVGRFILRRLRRVQDLRLVATTRTSASADRVRRELGLEVFTDNRRALSAAELIFLCVRPDHLREILEDLRGRLAEKRLVSLLVVFAPEELERLLGCKEVAVFHPTTYLHYAEGDFLSSFLIFHPHSSEGFRKGLKGLLGSAFGQLEEVKDLNALKEKIFLYGNLPAYLLDILGRLELLLRERLGLSEGEARGLILRALEVPFQEKKALVREVATPGGLTEKGLRLIDETLKLLFTALEANTHLQIDGTRGRLGHEGLLYTF